MQDQIAKVVQDIQNVMNKFPEFEEVKFGMITVENSDDQGGMIHSTEPSFLAREVNGDWLNYEDSSDVYTMNNTIDWSMELRQMLGKMGLRRNPVVFSRDEAQPEMIAQKFSERLEASSGSSMSVGM